MANRNDIEHDGNLLDEVNFEEHDYIKEQIQKNTEDIKQFDDLQDISLNSNMLTTLTYLQNNIFEDADNREQVNWDEHDEMFSDIKKNTEDIAIIKTLIKGNIQERIATTSIDSIKYQADEYFYNKELLHTFDNKIDVCKWFTRKLGNFNNGKYDISIKKNGIMINPTKLLVAAADNAYNYQLYQFAHSGDDYNINSVFNYTGGSKQIELNNHIFQGANNIPDNLVDWYLSAPYATPIDLIEDWTDERTLSYNSIGTDYMQVLTNCVACFDPRQDGSVSDDIRVVAVVIGANKSINHNNIRKNMITTSNSSSCTDVNQIKQLGEKYAYDLYKCWSNKDQNYSNLDNAKAIYVGLAEIDQYNNIHIVYENYYKNNQDSRYHVVTCGAQIIQAQYYLRCDEEEIIDFEFNTMKDYELSRPWSPIGWDNECLGIDEYGNNSKILDMTSDFENTVCCALHNDNTYCIYALWLHIYKGLTNAKKDTITPLVETECSLKNGSINISFPESNVSKIETSGGESALSYSEFKGTRTPAIALTEKDIYLKKKTYKDIEYIVDLTNNKIEFNNFKFENCFTLSLNIDLLNYNNIGETLVATIGNAKIYLCYSDTGVYPTISYSNTPYKSKWGIKIVDSTSQIYLGVGRMTAFITENNTDIQKSNYPVIISIYYNNGIWGIHKFYQHRGRG